MNYLNDSRVVFILKTILSYILIVFITTMIYCYYTSKTVNREGFGEPWERMGVILNPDENGFSDTMNPDKNGIGQAFEKALDPTQNGIGHMFDPNQNGISSFFSDIGDQFYELGVNEWNDDVDNIDNGLIFFEIFLKKTVPAFFKEFLGSYWRCFVKMLLNLYKCIIYYALDSIGQILYLPVRFIVWLFCMQFQENEFWEAVYELDDTFSCAYGFHLVHYPDSVIQDCYVCDIMTIMPRLPVQPKGKRTAAPPLFNDPDYIGNEFDAKLNPLNNGVTDALDPDKNGVGSAFKYAFSDENPDSIVHLGEVIDEIFEEFGEAFEDGITEIFNYVGGKVVEGVTIVKDKILDAFDVVVNTFKKIKSEIVAEFISIKDKIVTFFTDFGNTIKRVFEDGFRRVIDGITGAFDVVVNFFNRIKSTIIDTIMDVIDEISGLVKRIIGYIKGLFDKIKNAVVGAAKTVGNAFKSTARKVGGFFKKLFR